MTNRLITLLLLSTSALSAQTASVTYYGRGCQLPSSPPPLIRALSLPKIGTMFSVRFTGPNSITPVSQDQPVLLTGLAPATIPVPPLSALQPAGCQFLLAPLVFQFMPRSGSAYQGTVVFTIPNDRTLLGLTIYQQFASIYRNCRGGPCIDQMIRVSDGAKIVIGL